MLKWVSILLLYSGTLCAQTLTHHTYFDVDSHTLIPREEAALYTFLKAVDTLAITDVTLTGYCDDRGSTAYNYALSNKRAVAVKGYISPNIPVKIVALGEVALPDAAIDTVSVRSSNRRVNIRITYEQNVLRNTEAAITKPEPAIEKQPVFNGNYKKLTDTLIPGDKLLLKSLLFIGSKSVLKKRSEKDLKKLLVFLKENPGVHFEIQGHVCCIYSFQDDAIDSDTNTVNLSVTRAKRIYDYLLDNGIAARRMTYKGYGRKQPIEGGRESDNKRVEILITKIE